MAENQKELFDSLEMKIEQENDVLFSRLDQLFNKSSDASDLNNLDVDIKQLVERSSLQTEQLVLLNSSMGNLIEQITNGITAVQNTVPVNADVENDVGEEETERNYAVSDIRTVLADTPIKIDLDDLERVTAEYANTLRTANIEKEIVEIPETEKIYNESYSSEVNLPDNSDLIATMSDAMQEKIDQLSQSMVSIANDNSELTRDSLSELANNLRAQDSNAEPVNIDIDPITVIAQDIKASIDSESNTMFSYLEKIGETSDEIAKATSSISLDRVSTSLDDLVNRVDNLDVGKIELDEDSINKIIPQSLEFDYSYQDKILSVLSSPVDVNIANLPKDNENEPTENVDVFSRAVSPLVEGQRSLQSMLDSNLRRLSEAIVMLRDQSRDSESRITRVTDTVNTEMSETSIKYILSDTSQIRVTLSHIDSTLSAYLSENSTSSSSTSVESDEVTSISMD
jgi:hypothetical protein